MSWDGFSAMWSRRGADAVGAWAARARAVAASRRASWSRASAGAFRDAARDDVGAEGVGSRAGDDDRGVRGDGSDFWYAATPPVPSWRAEDPPTALRWLRKYLRGSNGGLLGPGVPDRLLRERRVRVARRAAPRPGDEPSASAARWRPDEVRLRRVSRAHLLPPGAWLCVPRELGLRGDVRDDASTVRSLRKLPKPTRADVARARDMLLHVDDDVIVIDKPAGLTVVPGPHFRQGERSVHSMLAAFAAAVDADQAPRIAHRIDRDTSGCLVLARNAMAARALAAAFRANAERQGANERDDENDDRDEVEVEIGVDEREGVDVREGDSERLGDVAGVSSGESGLHLRSVAKTYWALVSRHPSVPRGVIRARVDDRRAETSYAVLGSNDAASNAVDGGYPALLELTPKTGRRHQLRAHCAETLGCVIVGDYKHGYRDVARATRSGRRGEEREAWRGTLRRIEASAERRAASRKTPRGAHEREREARREGLRARNEARAAERKAETPAVDSHRVEDEEYEEYEGDEVIPHDEEEESNAEVEDGSATGRRRKFALGVPLHLHARAVTFPHPRTGERVTVTAPPPPHIVAACRALRIPAPFDGRHESRRGEGRGESDNHRRA